MSVNEEQNERGSRSRIANYQKILANNPRSFIFAQLAEEYIKLKEADKAIEICRAGLQYNPGFSDGLYVLGVAYFKKGLKDEGRRVFVKILETQPDHYLARDALRRMGYDDDSIENMKGEETGELLLVPEGAEEDSEPAEPLTRRDRTRPELRAAARLPTRPGVLGVQSAYRGDAVVEEEEEDAPTKEGPKSVWLPVILLLILGLLSGGGYFGYQTYMETRAAEDIALTYNEAREGLFHDTYAAYVEQAEKLEKAVARHPKALNLKALLTETYAKLLISYAPDSHKWQAALETLNAAFPADSLTDSDILTAQSYRAFFLNKPGEVRFLIDNAGDRGTLTPEMTCLDGELHLFDRDYKGAIKLFEESIADEPRQQRPLYHKALVLEAQKDYTGAKITLDLLLEKEPGHVLGQLLRWQTILFSGGDLRQVEKELKAFSEERAASLSRLPLARLQFLNAFVENKLGRKKVALEQVRRSVDLRPDPNALYLLATLQYEQKEFDKAKASILKAIAQRDDEKKYHSFLGRLYFQEENRTQALEQMEMAIDDSTDELDLLVMAGEAAMQLRMHDKAARYFERASFVNFQNLDLKKKLILTYIAKQDMRDARNRIEKLLLDHADDPVTYYLNGVYYLADGQPEKADKEFMKGLRLDPLNREILLEVAKLNFTRGEIDLGYGTLLRLNEKYPDDEDVLRQLGEIALASEANAPARRYYRRLAELRPQIPTYRLFLAYLDYLDGKKSEARQAVEEELARNPNLGFGHILRGVFLFLEGDGKKAEPQLKRGIQLDSKNADGHYWLGMIKLVHGDRTWAKNEFDIALECQRIHPKALYEIGMIHFDKGNFESAREVFMQALTIFMLFPDVLSYPVKIYLRLGEIQIMKNRLNEGLKLIKKASQLDPNAAEPYYILARDGNKYRRPKEALKLLDKAQKLDPGLAEVHYERGMIHMSKDHLKDALTEFRTYLRKTNNKGKEAVNARTHIAKIESQLRD